MLRRPISIQLLNRFLGRRLCRFNHDVIGCSIGCEGCALTSQGRFLCCGGCALSRFGGVPDQLFEHPAEERTRQFLSKVL